MVWRENTGGRGGSRADRSALGAGRHTTEEPRHTYEAPIRAALTVGAAQRAGMARRITQAIFQARGGEAEESSCRTKCLESGQLWRHLLPPPFHSVCQNILYVDTLWQTCGFLGGA